MYASLLSLAELNSLTIFTNKLDLLHYYVCYVVNLHVFLELGFHQLSAVYPSIQSV